MTPRNSRLVLFVFTVLRRQWRWHTERVGEHLAAGERLDLHKPTLALTYHACALCWHTLALWGIDRVERKVAGV